MVSQERQAKIDAMKAQIAELEATGHREDLAEIVKKYLKNPEKVTDDDIYPFAKGFTNHVERQRKVANLEEARRKKAEKEQQEQSQPPVS